MELADRARMMGLGLLPARVALASTMIVHGKEKITAEGAEKTGEQFEKLEIRPGSAWARATGITEVGAGVLALLGIGTRLAALGILVTQAVAVMKVHLPKGFPITRGGYEFNASLMAIALGMMITGPGKLSAYAMIHDLAQRRSRRGWRGGRRTPAGLRFMRLLK